LRTEIAEITLFRLRLPLAKPYHLSFGDLMEFQTVLACVRTADGQAGWGETTPLAGYTHEDPEAVWRRTAELSRCIRTQSVKEALAFLVVRARRHPFSCVALATALESLSLSWRLGVADSVRDGNAARSSTPVAEGRCARVRLIGTIRSVSPEAVVVEVAQLLDQGYTSLKLKVGTDAATDLANVRAAQAALRGRGKIRIDANQGYSLPEAQKLMAALDPLAVECFEQPFPSDRWDWMRALGDAASVPLMLDESISSEEDLRRAARLPGVRYVKLKLMKAGSIARLLALVDAAHVLGLRAVVGNGVAGEIGCLHEAWAMVDRLDAAGEMNGFLKPVHSLLEEPLRVEKGELVLPSPGRVEVVRDRVERHCVASASV
jgi:L-alanine-DL-glutamate epimerase-like enolase superfamily enzyme